MCSVGDQKPSPSQFLKRELPPTVKVGPVTSGVSAYSAIFFLALDTGTCNDLFLAMQALVLGGWAGHGL